MTSGERIKAAISHKTIDRIPMIEIGFWDETIKRFQEEGMPEDFYFQPSIWSGGGYRTEQCHKTSRAKGIYNVIKPEEGCQYALYLLGDERCLEYMALQSKMIEDIIATYTLRQIEMLELFEGKGYKFDAIWLFSDLCYKNGMLFSPTFYRERVMPHHKRLFAWCKAHGMQVIYHCDGYVERLLPLLIESGIDCIQPLEVRCGNDVRIYKEKYKEKVSFIGNINADVLASDKDSIYQEVKSKVQIAKENGGYIFHSDHSVPPTVSLENYLCAVETTTKFGRYSHQLD